MGRAIWRGRALRLPSAIGRRKGASSPEAFARRLALVTAVSLLCVVGAASTAAAAPVKPTDYSVRGHWLSLPTAIVGRVDVFYLYPSAYTKESPDAPNVGPVDDPGMMQGAQAAFSRQATAFGPYARIFAPYYRQADARWSLSLPAAEHIRVEKGKPTRDAVAAFKYYIAHCNHGRPFILVGHSQGSEVMLDLLSEYMPSHPGVYRRMIAAYVPGYTVTRKYLDANHFRFAKGATDTGVIISWNTEAPTIGAPNPVLLPGALAINPITWTRKQTEAPAGKNLGSIQLDPATGRSERDAEGHLVRVLDLADARVDTAKGALICSTVDPADYYVGFPLGVYHTFDYPFYFFNVRANARARIHHYFAEKADRSTR
jgi:Protein of unknown function (DUF3089)